MRHLKGTGGSAGTWALTGRSSAEALGAELIPGLVGELYIFIRYIYTHTMYMYIRFFMYIKIHK